MDSTIQEELRNAYTTEYRSNAAKRVKGIAGWFLRQDSVIEKKLQEVDDASPRGLPLTLLKPLAYMFCISVLATVGWAAAPLVTLGVLGMGCGIGLAANAQISAAANHALDRDIGNGVLAERYRTERLQPQIDALEQKKSSLPAPGAAAGDFAAAVSPAQAAPPQPPRSVPQPPALQ